MDWMKNFLKKPKMLVRFQILDENEKVIKQKDLSDHYVSHFVALKGEWPFNQSFRDMILNDEELEKKFVLSEEQFVEFQKTIFENRQQNIEE